MAMSFDGIDDSVTATLMSSMSGVAAATIAAWVNTADSPSAGPLVSFSTFNGGVPTAASRAALDRAAGGAPAGVMRGPDGGAFNEIPSPNPLVNGVWRHVAVVLNYAGASCTVYENGVAVFTGPSVVAAATSATLSAVMGIGSEDNGGPTFFGGRMDDIRAYSRGLSAAEIQTIFGCRGTDGIVDGLRNRYALRELGIGGVAVGAGFVKDHGPDQRAGSPAGSPVYSDGVIRSRRKTA